MLMELRMVDISAISGLLSSLKASTDLTKAMLGLRDAQLVREKAVELTAEIMSAHQGALAAQSAQAALLSEVADLKQQIKKFEDWDREAQRYELMEIATGSFAYVLKPDMQAGETGHAICATCYQNRRKSILQAFARDHQWTLTNYLRCDTCKAEIVIGQTYSGPTGRIS
ncbi:hypothetical protein [Methylobacterium sp. WL9]|uniref:hypothetical protein n=1 Tax=Methylobacterium sp. WL9 TaxID=2603898 RepID=UPI0011C80FD9|nr:hypothetical protein [Methylobacterium sp. WL9]TXN23997.1 hypothetical protein FV217_04845 [Methylobacterium sp. WL9]